MNNKWEASMETLSVGEQFAEKVKDNARKDRIRRMMPIILLVVMTAIGAITQKNFFSARNLVNILYQMSIPLVISVSLMFVLLLGSIDLSIEGVMGFAGSFTAFLVQNRTNSNNFGIFGIILVLVICTCVGAITGFIHTKGRIASFITTYAVGQVMTGVAVLVYNSTPIAVTEPAFATISQGRILGIPYLTLMSFGIFAIGAIILNFTAFGRAVYAIGDNETAAASTGINVTATKIKVFALSALMASAAGVLMCIRLKLGQSSIGLNQMFPVVTSIVLGGGSLYGGKGGALSAFVGVLVYTELSNWLTLMGVDTYLRGVIQGIIIIVAVTLTIERTRKTISK